MARSSWRRQRHASAVHPLLEALEDRTTPAVHLAVGTGPGVEAVVNTYDEQGTLQFSLLPFVGFAGGVTVASKDVNRDGIEDVIVGAGAGPAGGHVKVFDGTTGAEIRSFLAFPGFAGGVNVGAGFVNFDLFADIIVGAGPGSAGGHVKVFDGATGAEIRSFFAFEGSTGGVTVAGGDAFTSGSADIVVGSAKGGVKVFDGVTGDARLNFQPFPGYSGKVSVGAGDIDRDGTTKVVVGAGPGPVGGHVKVFNRTTGAEERSFYAFDGFTGGVNVAAGGFGPTGPSRTGGPPPLRSGPAPTFGPIGSGPLGEVVRSVGQLIVGAGPGAGPHVKVFESPFVTERASFFAFDALFTGGVFVG